MKSSNCKSRQLDSLMASDLHSSNNRWARPLLLIFPSSVQKIFKVLKNMSFYQFILTYCITFLFYNFSPSEISSVGVIWSGHKFTMWSSNSDKKCLVHIKNNRTCNLLKHIDTRQLCILMRSQTCPTEHIFSWFILKCLLM